MTKSLKKSKNIRLFQPDVGIFNFQPWLDWYLNTTGQRLVGGNAAAPAGGHGGADATSGASDSGDAGGHGGGADATSGASN